MTAREIVPGVFSVGAVDWDRRLFDELIPLPHGTSYNSYLVKGNDKTALIDTVDPVKEYELISNLCRMGIERIDYIVINHAEQDHTGSLPMILEFFPDAVIVTNEKCKDLLIALLHVPADKLRIVRDREKLSLGNRTLQFLSTPWTHWPETQLTFLEEDRILFTCDLFGSHIATSDLIMTDERATYLAAKRYYAEIMMPFRSSIRGYVETVRGLSPAMIAPSHGPVYKNPSFILDAYADWTSDAVKNEVVLPFVSMHGSTLKMVDYFTDALIARGITVKPFNLSRTDTGELAMALVDAATVVIATPTVLFGPHPLVVYAAYLTNLLRPKTRFVSVIGSYGWGGKASETVVKMIDHMKAEPLDTVMVRGLPDEAALRGLDRLADEIAQKHRALNLL